MTKLVDNCSHEMKIRSLVWKPPNDAFMNLNTDGSALSNPGSIYGGVIPRDSWGNMIYAFIIPLGVGTNNQAMVQTATYGLQWCINHGYQNVILEVDS